MRPPTLFLGWILVMVGYRGLTAEFPVVREVEAQPLASQTRRILNALDFLGAPLSSADRESLDAALRGPDNAVAAVVHRGDRGGGASGGILLHELLHRRCHLRDSTKRKLWRATRARQVACAIGGEHGKHGVFERSRTPSEDAFKVLDLRSVLVGGRTDADKGTRCLNHRFLRQETPVCILLARSPDAGDAVALRDCGHEQDRTIGALGLGEPSLEITEPDDATFGPIACGACVCGGL